MIFPDRNGVYAGADKVTKVSGVIGTESGGRKWALNPSVGGSAGVEGSLSININPEQVAERLRDTVNRVVDEVQGCSTDHRTCRI